MSEQTKLSRFLPWLVAFSVALGISVLVGMFEELWMILMNPWSIAERVVSEIAINDFSGEVIDPNAFGMERIQALLGLLVLFVIGPSLWIYSEIKNQDSGDTLKKGFTWYAGAVILIAGLFIAVPATVIKGVVFQNSWESAAKSENADSLRGQLSRLAYEAFELYYLPQDLGGGEGSFRSIPDNDGSMRSIRLEDLENYDTTSQNSFVLAPVESDSIITIYGVGHKKGSDPDFENANGEQGMLQLAVEVNPGDGIFDFVSRNTNKR